ncbi:MAG: DNA primase [Haloferacaceae archaeon]
MPEVDPRHARYPFLSGAREAVAALSVAPAELARADAPAVERGAERVERALMAGEVDAEEPERWRPRDELLSYPVARVLVSLLDDDAATRKYAVAEAATARARLEADAEADGPDLQTVESGALSLSDALREFGVAGAVNDRDDDRFGVDVGVYLRLSDPTAGERWRLVNRALADGRVPVERAELFELLEERIRARVAEGLPIPVGGEAGETLADALSEEVTRLRTLLADRTPRVETGRVDESAFPPCIEALLGRARDGEDLPPRSRFALVAFLVDLGMDEERVAAETGLPAAAVEFPVTVLADGDGSQYPMPSCETMDAQGDCVNTDEVCERVAHPLAYYPEATD